MGLDMYLKAQRYVNKQDYSVDPPATRDEYKALAHMYPELDNDTIYGFDVSRVVAYWRKANAIHQWFVVNVQDGEDDCREYPVSLEHLTDLVNLCNQVLANREMAEDELPPQPGFFFGSTDIDEYYWADLNDTVTQLTRIINDPRLKDHYLTYQASW